MHICNLKSEAFIIGSDRGVLLVRSSRAHSASEMNYQIVVSTVRAGTIQIGVVADEIVIIRICIALHVQFFTVYPCG